MTEPRIVDRPEQPYLAVRREVTDGVPAAVDSAFPELVGWLGANGVQPTGPPFIRVNVMDDEWEPLELECAAPVGDDVAAGGPVHRDVLPAGRYATVEHVGPYRSETARDLAAARWDVLCWMAENAHFDAYRAQSGTGFSCAIDILHVGPESEPNPSRWRTELARLIVTSPVRAWRPARRGRG